MTESPTVAASSSLHLLTGAYAVDALDDLERARFEAHLDGCVDCRQEVAELSEAVVELTRFPAVVGVPASLGPTVRSAIARVRPLPPLVEGGGPRGLTRAQVGRPRRLAPLLVAASVVAMVGVGVAVWPDADPGSSSAASASAAVFGASDVRRSTVDFEQGASATVYHSDSLGRAVLVTTGLAPAPKGMVYAVWLDQPATGLAPAGFLSGEADQWGVLTGDAASAEGAAITVEALGGGDKPTGSPMAAFDFGQGA